MLFANHKTLLLNSTYDFLSFINERKVYKMLVKGKIEIVSVWEDVQVLVGNKILNHPAIVKLTHYVNKKYTRMCFSRKSVFRRDQYICQYCGAGLNSKTITMDHIVPKSKGGKSTFLNCVASCKPCNIRKGSKTLEQCGYVLLNEPEHPKTSSYFFVAEDHWHKDWATYINL